MTDQTAGAQGRGEARPEGTRSVPVFTPPADIYETKDALVLLLEMPGVERDSINITLDRRVLTITGQCNPGVPEGYSLSHAEYREGDYERAFTLSEEIDSERIEATLKNGVLKVTLPKVKPAPARTITVKAG